MGHVNGNYEARDPTMALYLTEVKQLAHCFNRLSVTRVPQAQNISVAHPQTNGQAEVMNRAILKGLKKRVSGACGAWVDELPSVLWSMQTTPKTASGESPFSLVFGTEVVLPPEMVFPTLCTTIYEQDNSEEGL
ncbi:uncharacterized protein LOC135673893 [Musa acuminata AAA Group]|uniref:uncharacterized protein LOC135673893 n=1 Tax=Musa acuminata AAA Group TaxID=214697 RepID=UPI0031E20CA8